MIITFVKLYDNMWDPIVRQISNNGCTVVSATFVLDIRFKTYWRINDVNINIAAKSTRDTSSYWTNIIDWFITSFMCGVENILCLRASEIPIQYTLHWSSM